MKITFTVGAVNYTADLDGSSYTLIRHGINQDKESKNFGEPTEISIGYFTVLGNAVNKALQDSFGSQEESVTLKGFCERVENARAEISKQIGNI